LATSPEDLQELVCRVERAAKEYNTLINATKTKVMTNIEDVLEITVTGGQLEQVDSFVCLGSSIKNNTDCVGEVKSRLAMGMAVMGKLTKI